MMPALRIAIAAWLLQSVAATAGDRIHENSRAAHARADFDGTYAFIICTYDCDARHGEYVNGILVIDESGRGFEGENDAMRHVMRADILTDRPQYCYFFDPATSHREGTTFEYDTPVGFGNLVRVAQNRIQLFLLVSSPDFRYTSIATRSAKGFTGDLMSLYREETQTIPDTYLRAERIGGPDTTLCFKAVRKYERAALWGACHGFPSETCEPGDKEAASPPNKTIDRQKE